jgi:hypothetical protein
LRERARCVASATDGKTLLLIRNEEYHLYSTASGKYLRTLDRQRTDFRTPPVYLDGDTVVVLEGNDEYKMVGLYDVRTGRRTRLLDRHLRWMWEDAHTLAASAEDSSVALAGHARGIYVLNVVTGRLRADAFVGHEATVTVLAYSRDGRTLVSGSRDGSVRLWETATGRERSRINPGAGGVVALDLSPDGRRAVAVYEHSPPLIWDLTDPEPGNLSGTADLPARELERLWADLGGEAPAGYRAVQALVRRPGQAVPFLRERLRAGRPQAVPAVARLLEDLDDENFAKRQAARAELEKRGEEAIPALRQMLRGKPTLEARRRAQEILNKLEPVRDEHLLPSPVRHPEFVRLWRSLEVLEWCGTNEARQLLESLAAGPGGAWLTVEAQATLERLRRRPPQP